MKGRGGKKGEARISAGNERSIKKERWAKRYGSEKAWKKKLSGTVPRNASSEGCIAIEWNETKAKRVQPDGELTERYY